MFKELGKPILIGVSRKSFIGNILKLPPEGRLEGSLGSFSDRCCQRGIYSKNP